jgi:hypothetical protein
VALSVSILKVKAQRLLLMIFRGPQYVCYSRFQPFLIMLIEQSK